MGGMFSRFGTKRTAGPMMPQTAVVAPQTRHMPAPGGEPAQEALDSRNRLLEAFEVLRETVPGLPGIGLALDPHGYRSLGKSIRDINDVARLNELYRAEWQARYVPLCNRAIGIRTDLVVSEGFDLLAVVERAEKLDKAVIDQYRQAMQRVLDDYWQRNEWDDRLYERVRDIGLTGEGIRRLPPTSLDTHDGPFKPGFFRGSAVLPHLVRAVHIDPWDAERLVRLSLQPGAFNVKDPKELELKILCRDYYGTTAGWITGDVNFIAVNRQVGQSRGTSDLTIALDWADLHDQSLINDNERALELLKYLWDIELQDADPEALQQYANELKKLTIKPGTKRIHGPNEKWTVHTPDLNVSESAALREGVWQYAWGALGLPKSWYVEAEYASVASAMNTSSPAFRWARTRRRGIMGWILIEAQYALQVASQAGRLDVPLEHLGCKLDSRDPNRDQYEPAANALKAIADAFTTAISGGFGDVNDARKVFREFSEGFGIELLTEEEAKQASGAPPENPLEQVVKEAREVLERHRPRLEKGSAVNGLVSLSSSEL